MEPGLSDGRSVIAIRTHRWGEDEERLTALLSQVKGHDLAVVFHNRPEDVAPPIDVVDISDTWVQEQGLRVLPDWGWRCGDYFYYALRSARPGYDYYWLIEPDVHFTGDPDGFFASFVGHAADGLGYRLGPFKQNNRFARGLPDLPLFRAIFALTRLSGRAIDLTFERRRTYCAEAGAVLRRYFTNDEIFIFSHLDAEPDLTTERLEAVAPGWFDGTQFDTNPDLLLESLSAIGIGEGRVCHPVRGRESFKRALAVRIHGAMGFLKNFRGGLRELSDEEINEVADLAIVGIRRELKRHKRTRR